jgi:hypothetical protein
MIDASPHTWKCNCQTNDFKDFGPITAVNFERYKELRTALRVLRETLMEVQLKISGDDRAAASDVLCEQIERALRKTQTT